MLADLVVLGSKHPYATIVAINLLRLAVIWNGTR